MDKIFPYNVFKFTIEDFENLNKNLISEIYNLKNKDEKGIHRSNKEGGWHSQLFHTHKDKFPEDEYPNLGKLRKLISDYFNREISTIDKDIEIDNMWVNINKKDSYNSIHDHQNSFYSGVYYVRVPENSGNIYFYNPEIWFTDAIDNPELFLNKKYETEKIEYNSKEGDLYFFVCNLPHGVDKNLSNNDRISISFNINFGYIRTKFKDGMNFSDNKELNG